MSIEKILVPDLGDFKDVEIIEVLVKSGQNIKKNDSLITLESDKSSVEVPSTHNGVIKNIDVKVGDKVNKGDLILSLEVDQKKSEIKTSASKETENKEIPEKKKLAPLNKKVKSVEGAVKSASPKIRKFAREMGADIFQIAGTERLGRVTVEDVKKHIKSKLSSSGEGQINKTKYKDEYDHSEFGEIEIKDIPRVKGFPDLNLLDLGLRYLMLLSTMKLILLKWKFSENH